VVVLLVRGRNRAPEHVSEKRREERELEEVEQRLKEAGAHQNRRWKPSISAGFGGEIRQPGCVSDVGNRRGERGDGGAL
jgi:hypothetical protein